MDLPLLAETLLASSAQALGKTVSGFATETLAALATYDWPGNVRELQNEILRMVALGEGPVLLPVLLSGRVRQRSSGAAVTATHWSDDLSGNLKTRMEALERVVLEAAMRRHRGNKSRAAQELGLSRVGLRAKLQRHGMTDE